ncbi:VQ motif-containing protein 31 [Carica papaya]|uniref:VQ motif-containing protein 31 n=1 Tax=Carica papaya TaxID=3649 RepID=UPI000B8CAFBE|nr:VQ motif-containing protein 31 [Carica papaya]XP_021889874.1 VQ motif-containing protein 31 [Carica papaya]
MEKSATQGATSCRPLTTFVQTDTDTFREVVQRLTGPSESSLLQEGAAMKIALPKKPTSKLHERRQLMRPKLEIVKPSISFRPGTSPSKPGNTGFLTSPVGTPSTIFSKLSIFEEEIKESAVSELNSEEEERAIKERRFYLHPSPRTRPGYTEPQLLTLFPLTSPKVSDKP